MRLKQRTVWLVTGVGLTIVMMLLFQAWRAEAVGSSESTFVPVTPCRLMDTRVESNVGPRAKPLGPSRVYNLQVTGTNGDCIVPTDATAIAMNVTSVNATAASFLQMWPAFEVQPLRGSSLNYVPGQAPTPNKVDVKLSPDGYVAVFNRFGRVDVIADVVGYYTNSGLTDFEARLAGLESDMETLRTDDVSTFARLATLEADNQALMSAVATLEADVAALELLTESMTIETVDDQPTLRFSGVNVQVVNGLGDSFKDPNALGNLIMGYNESVNDTRTGSHNVVIGVAHSYPGSSGLLGGRNNTVDEFGAVAFGDANLATGDFAVVVGGTNNEASGTWSTVSGGFNNTTAGDLDSLAGGDDVMCDTAFPQAITCGEGTLGAAD